MFEGLGNKDSKKFNVMPCWNVLKNEDKWKSKRIELLQLEKEAATAKSSKKRKKQPSKASEPREPEGSNNDHQEENGGDTETVATKREMGSRRLKRRLGEEVVKLAWRPLTSCGQRRRLRTLRKRRLRMKGLCCLLS